MSVFGFVLGCKIFRSRLKWWLGAFPKALSVVLKIFFVCFLDILLGYLGLNKVFNWKSFIFKVIFSKDVIQDPHSILKANN